MSILLGLFDPRRRREAQAAAGRSALYPGLLSPAEAGVPFAFGLPDYRGGGNGLKEAAPGLPTFGGLRLIPGAFFAAQAHGEEAQTSNSFGPVPSSIAEAAVALGGPLSAAPWWGGDYGPPPGLPAITSPPEASASAAPTLEATPPSADVAFSLKAYDPRAAMAVNPLPAVAALPPADAAAASPGPAGAADLSLVNHAFGVGGVQLPAATAPTSPVPSAPVTVAMGVARSQ